MSKTNKIRSKAGFWLLGLVGFVLSILGIRYASSNGWFANVFQRNTAALEPINTGVIVPVSVSGVQTLTPPPRPSPSPSPNNNDNDNDGSFRPGRQMW
jgi:hypothetical protein